MTYAIACVSFDLLVAAYIVIAYGLIKIQGPRPGEVTTVPNYLHL